MKKNMVTIKDIASKAGVTPATVSMALNGKDSVSSSTRRRIERIAKELGYYPSATAKALRTSKSNTLGLIVGNLKNDFFLDIIYAVEEYASSRDYVIFVCDAERNSEKVVSSLRALAARGVDGILISIGFYPDKALEGEIQRISKEGIRVLSFTSAVSMEGVPLVDQEEVSAINELVDRIASLGHRKVAVISSPVGSWIYNTRFQQRIKRAMETRGIYSDDLVFFSEMNSDAGEACATSVLSKHSDITAFICVNDLIAVGVMKAVRKAGYRIPEDISIVGCDGLLLSSLVSPALTTVRLPRYEMGLAGSKIMIEWLDEGHNSFPDKTLIVSSIIDGETLANARKEENI